MPEKKLEDGMWTHPSRLPLRGGWSGHCCATGHEDAEISREELNGCNLGYATNCPRLPRERSCDAVRFSVAQDMGEKLLVCYVCERDHHPVEHGTLEFNLTSAQWNVCHGDTRIQRMAECYVEKYLERRAVSAIA